MEDAGASHTLPSDGAGSIAGAGGNAAGAGGSGAGGSNGAAPGGAGRGGIPGNGGNGRPGVGAAGALFFLPFLRPMRFTSEPVDGDAVLNLTSKTSRYPSTFTSLYDT